ncbi:MAG TPA: hypothetical protein VK789_16485 [Bryobacteraceae bacterium]|jgi:hypothetical protein|nr:hypothetical protein [Bryobacteraceae bacterium]
MSRLLAFAAVLVVAAPVFAQAPPAAPGPARSGRQGALEDITGYWVSLVTEDWRYRMVTPTKGDVGSIPVTPEGRKAAEAWDPAKDEAAGEQCKAYGAPGLMRRPTRLHITWQDDNTLKVETDEGTQTRLFHFGAEAPAKQASSLQGYSVATWDVSAPAGGGGGGRGGLAPGAPPAGRGGRGGGPPPGPGSMKVVTTDLKPGYLHKNGVPYGAKTVLTEYFTRTNDSDGTSWLILTADVEDGGQYIRGDFLTSTHYLKEPDGSKWDPSPCSAR